MSRVLASGTIHAECASKSNSRQVVRFGKRSALIKNAKARAFIAAQGEVSAVPSPILDPVTLTCDLYYSSRRPDLDAGLVMDWLQANHIIENDRQVFQLFATKHLDPESPRVTWSLTPYVERVRKYSTKSTACG